MKYVLTAMVTNVTEKVANAQKFQGGDRIVVDKLPKYMSHFNKGKGVVLYSYAQYYAPEDVSQANSYCILFDDGTEVSWYPASVLKRI